MKNNEKAENLLSKREPLIMYIICVGFHHSRGPEIEYCYPELSEIPVEWSLLPFMALPDGVHLLIKIFKNEEDFSYFCIKNSNDKTLFNNSNYGSLKTIYGISCTRQLLSSELMDRPIDVTRSTIQKSIVLLVSRPAFGHIKEKLRVVTHAYFSQRNFEDRNILMHFYDSFVQIFHNGINNHELYLGIPLRELLYQFRWKTLVVLKAMLLEQRILFYGTRSETLCIIQYSFLSLIPGLLENLQDASDPLLNTIELQLKKSTSLCTNNRKSLLLYMGMPFQIFSKGSFFGPYTPLQQIKMLENESTKSYIIGSTNSLFLQMKKKYADLVVNVDTGEIDILHPLLKNVLSLSFSDKKWINSIIMSVINSWDESDTSRPKSMGFLGSEEDLRAQFEEYFLALAATVKYDNYLNKIKNLPNFNVASLDTHENTIRGFGRSWIEQWKFSENYRLWNKYTDDKLFDVVEPKHPAINYGVSLENMQYKLARQVQELKLNERAAIAKKTINKGWNSGSQKISQVMGSLFDHMESYRTERRKRYQEIHPQYTTTPDSEIDSDSSSYFSNMQSKAGYYVSAFADWAYNKKRTVQHS
ncbi:hypothetical protein PORY_002618 [Pneumocystis oryctolagi]|uniref:Uncharacterized protein n=1 Tax=Pneumocystis oryctolagi TaxID=42067 RepID=A0ACB7C955_9ASCO|nr:hypothetical protein PORY_002618 [Pneumocystis oryctolagi]